MKQNVSEWGIAETGVDESASPGGSSDSMRKDCGYGQDLIYTDIKEMV